MLCVFKYLTMFYFFLTSSTLPFAPETTKKPQKLDPPIAPLRVSFQHFYFPSFFVWLWVFNWTKNKENLLLTLLSHPAPLNHPSHRNSSGLYRIKRERRQNRFCLWIWSVLLSFKLTTNFLPHLWLEKFQFSVSTSILLWRNAFSPHETPQTILTLRRFIRNEKNHSEVEKRCIWIQTNEYEQKKN